MKSASLQNAVSEHSWLARTFWHSLLLRSAFALRSPYLWLSVASAISFISLWEIAAVLGVIDPQFFPPPSYVIAEFSIGIADGTLLHSMIDSIRRVMIGFTLSVLIGIPLGIAIGVIPILRWIIDPLLSVIRPLPSLAWIPISLLWLGLGETQKFSIVFMGTIAPLTIFVADATRQVDWIFIKAARNLGASRWRIMLEISLPAALPSILSAMKVTLALAWTCIISAEMVGAHSGFGFLIWNAKDWGNASQVIIGMLMISVTVLFLDSIFNSIAARLVPWKQEVAN
jgi:taurine transport system permease protein